MEEVTFRELVKKVHPDLNPNIKDAGHKMSLITKYRNDQRMLIKLASEWGFIESKYDSKTNTTTYFFEIGNVVVYHKTKRAVIVDIENAKGKRSGQYKVFIVDIKKNKLYHFFVPTLKTELRDIKVIGKSSFEQKLKADDIYLKYVNNKEERKETKKNRDKSREESNKEHLNPYRDYWDFNVWVWSKTRYGMFRVIRTTAKMVYYWDHHENKERSFKMSSIIRIEYI